MPVRAESDPRYYRRFTIMGIAALGAALWFLYDGAVKYPRQRERALVLQELLNENRVSEWDAIARERGWPTSDPGEPKTDSDIILQYVFAGILALVGFGLLWGVWRARGTWIESTDSGITSSWGQSLNFDKVVAVDKRKWRSKGIAKVTYNDNGRKRRFIVDDYKFDRHSTGDILRDLEAQIDPALISGGPPEAVHDESHSEAMEHEESVSDQPA